MEDGGRRRCLRYPPSSILVFSPSVLSGLCVLRAVFLPRRARNREATSRRPRDVTARLPTVFFAARFASSRLHLSLQAPRRRPRALGARPVAPLRRAGRTGVSRGG